MKRFTNSQRTNYHHDTVDEFSKNNRFITSGEAKGYNVEGYSWIADFIYKNTGNLSINPHVGYISFISDKDIAYQEYGNISDIYNEYWFLPTWNREIFSDYTYELETKQYLKISQKYGEYDIIEYINASELLFPSGLTYEIPHEFYRAPASHAEGYKLDLGQQQIPNKYDNFDMYLWARDNDNISIIGERSLELNFEAIAGDLPTTPLAIYNSNDGIRERIVDYKLNVDSPRYFYFEEIADQALWVAYYNEATHYQGRSFYPYYGAVQLYYDDFTEMDFNFDAFGEETGILFFPEVIQNNVLEPAKIVAVFGYDGDAPVDPITAPKGSLTFNPGNHLNDPADQSRIVYNVCRRMINYYTDHFEVKREVSGFTVFDGIDIDTERNRRYSAVTMTEPYFVTEPLGSGELVEYSFVNSAGEPINYADAAAFAAAPDMFLKIKAPLHIFTELNGILNTEEFNTDIINTLVIDDPTSKLANFQAGSDYYSNFGPASAADFFSRQDDCVDDLIKGVIGTGYHRQFYITSYGDDILKYSNSRMKICGLGFSSKTTVNAAGIINGTENILNMYCTNYVATDCPAPDENPPTGAPDEDTIIGSSFVNKYQRYEKFRPMIKLPGMNGYVKITERNIHFKTSRSADGKYEMFYNVEFPYCPGSYQERVAMDFTNGATLTGFILNKKSYINAGSHEVYGGGSRHDPVNNRYAPIGDDSFTNHSILLQYASSGILQTDPSKYGGEPFSLKAQENSRINYPVDLIWKKSVPESPDDEWELLSLRKPRFETFGRYGTYEVHLSEDDPGSYFSRDMKLFGLVDNRQWKFAGDRFSSYIGKENPAFICEIDISTVLKDFSEHQKLHGSIPDSKRWLYGYFSGFANMMTSTNLEDNEEKLTTMGNINDLTVADSNSNMILEIWDSKSNTGDPDNLGNWRPFIATSFDFNKIQDAFIVGDVYASGDPGTDDDESPTAISEIYEIFLGCFQNDTFDFPLGIKYGASDDLINGKSNLVLYDTIDKKSFNISYIKSVSDPSGHGRQIYKAFVYYNPTLDGPLKTLDPADPEAEAGAVYKIMKPLKIMSKSPKFSTTSIRAIDGIDAGYLTKNVDLKSDTKTPAATYTDLERFVVDEKMYFRLRVAKAREYPVSYVDNDTSEFLYEGQVVDPDFDGSQWVNNPWTEDGMNFDGGFDWGKIVHTELTRKFGLNYFKCASK